MSGSCWWPWRRRPAPPRGYISFVAQKGTHRMAALLGTVTLSAPDPKVSVAKRTVTVTVGTATPLALDATSGHASFPCNDGDNVSVSAVDTSAGGVDSAPATWSGVAHDSITAPASPTVSVSFAPAPPAP